MEIERTITLLDSHYARLRDNYFIARQVLLAGIESQKKKKTNWHPNPLNSPRPNTSFKNEVAILEFSHSFTFLSTLPCCNGRQFYANGQH